MASWDDEEFEPDVSKNTETIATDKWDGEDEDDDLKDNWDDDDDDEEKKETETKTVKVKKKKTIAEKIKEREEKRKEEALKRQQELKEIEESQKELTPEEQLELRLKNQRLQEESDLELAKDAFGVTEPLPGQKTIDHFDPKNKEEFLELSKMITEKLSKYERQKDFPNFLENLIRDLCAGVDPDEIKKITNSLNILASEKQKLTKAAKGGKKQGKKGTLTAGKASKNDMDFDDDSYYNEYEDFM